MTDCTQPGVILLFEVYGEPGAGGALLPVGLFCEKHWNEERNRLRSDGQRTATQVMRDDPGPCCWVDPMTPTGELLAELQRTK